MREFTLEDFKDTDYTYAFLRKLKELDPSLNRVYEPDLHAPRDLYYPVIISEKLTTETVNNMLSELTPDCILYSDLYMGASVEDVSDDTVFYDDPFYTLIKL